MGDGRDWEVPHALLPEVVVADRSKGVPPEMLHRRVVRGAVLKKKKNTKKWRPRA